MPHRYVALKAAAPEHYQHRLLVRALTAWRHRTANKQHAEQQRRLAVRHNYLHTLSKALQAWRESMEAAGHKQQQVAAVQQHYNTKLLSKVLQVGVSRTYLCRWHMMYLATKLTAGVGYIGGMPLDNVCLWPAGVARSLASAPEAETPAAGRS